MTLIDGVWCACITCRFPTGDKKMRQEYIEPEVDLCIETLSKPLRRRLVLHTRRDLVERVPWFLGRPMKFVADVCPLLRSSVASPLEVVGPTLCGNQPVS